MKVQLEVTLRVTRYFDCDDEDEIANIAEEEASAIEDEIGADIIDIIDTDYHVVE